MEILLIGDFSRNFDEGMKNVAKYVYQYLSRGHKVSRLDVKRIGSKHTMQTLKDCRPDLIHYFTGPTLASFVLLRILSARWPKSKIVLSALHPRMTSFLENSVLRSIAKSIVRPDLVLYQSRREVFSDIARCAMFFPNGVDTTKFRPVTKERKLLLRAKYNVDADKFVNLHVGHLSGKGNRNLGVLSRLQQVDDDCQVLIVGSTYLGKNQRQIDALVKAGCRIMEGYTSEIEEIYALSDCYIFPVTWGNSINIPLSVLEAMSCNLPVISLNYPGLRIFEEGNGLFFVESVDEIVRKSRVVREMMRNNEIDVRTRSKVLSCSWTNLVERLEKTYGMILEA